MVEKRTNERVNPPEGSSVLNQMNNKKMGRIIDISANGFLMAGRSTINPGMIFQLALQINVEPVVTLIVGAECIWSDLQTSGLTFAGFQIIDLSVSGQTELDQVIQQLTGH